MTDTAAPDVIVVSAEKPLRLSADCMRALKKATGRSMSELMQDEEDDANRIQVIAFAELFRYYVPSGHMPDAGLLWETAGTIQVDLMAPVGFDPLERASSETSPPSADTGG